MSEDIFSKMCGSCGFQPAMLFFRTFDGSTISEQGFCPQCALKKFSEGKGLDLKIANTDILHTINEMCGILSDIAGHISKVCEKKSFTDIEHLKCQRCSYALLDFIEIGSLGCSFCYSEFAEYISKELSECNFSKIHKGHIPSRYRKDHILHMEIERLSLKLSSLLNQELYEEAAKLSKRIAKLKSQNIDIFL